MSVIKGLLFVSLLCVTVAASAHEVKTISITGTASYGFSMTEGDYRIQGSALNLFQADPDGPSLIGFCSVGSLCSFTWSPADASSFCSYCTGYSGGSFGSSIAQYLSPDLVFKGSAFYSGGDTLTMNVTVSGTIYGYQLVGCNGNIGCSLGPLEFALKISGTGTETLTMTELSGSPSEIVGLQATFSGTATPVTTTPEPASLVLTASGLVGLWIRRRSHGKVCLLSLIAQKRRG